MKIDYEKSGVFLTWAEIYDLIQHSQDHSPTLPAHQIWILWVKDLTETERHDAT